MDIGRITEGEIRRALEHVRQARPLDGNALLAASLVAGRVRREGLTDTTESRSWALAGLLETIIRTNLETARGDPGHDAAVAQVRTLDDAKALILADFASAQPDREAWSCLYYRYFSRHAFQVGELAALARPHMLHGRRYIGRRIGRGLEMLRTILHELELAADASAPLPRLVASGRGDATNEPLPGPRHNLPVRLSAFIGRDDAIASILGRLADGRLVTLTGTGGSGKTRLALEAAERLVERFPEGVWFVPLGGLNDPTLVPGALADALGVAEEDRLAPLAAVIDAIGDAPSLIVLDNCEHLIEASARLAETLLQACPNARVLATSRELLGVDGELSWPVPPLDVPPVDARDDAGRVAQYAAVQLFVVRARAVAPSFALDDDNARAVAELCARLDGLPLALELAAARVGTLAPAQILARLDERFMILDHGRRTADPRQRTLWAAIEWSHALLAPAEQVLLRRLAAFRDGWAFAAAEAVCADNRLPEPSIMPLLLQLVEKSLVLPSQGGSAEAARFDVLESIREFAAIKLGDAGEAVWIRRRHLRWCLALAEEAGVALTGRDQSRWLARLTQEAENLRAALAFAADDPESAEDGLRMVALLTPFWRLRGRPSEGRHWIGRLLDTPAGVEPTALRARALDGAGALAFQQGDHAAARALHGESLAIHRRLGDQHQVAESLRHLGNVADESGEYEAAVACYDEALAIWRAADNAWGVAATLNNLGLVALRQGDYDTARARLEDSLARFRDLGNEWAVAVTLSNLGDAALARGLGAEARQNMADSLTLARRLDDHEGIAYALVGMAHAECVLGQLRATRRLLGESLVVLERMGSKLGLVEWLEVAAVYATARERLEDAVQIQAAVDALRTAMDSPLPPKDQPAKDAALAALRAQLGTAEFDSLWVVGSTLRWQDAAALAMTGDVVAGESLASGP